MLRHGRRAVRAARARVVSRARRLSRVGPFGHIAAHPLGRYAKRHSLGCGRARCGLCHPEKRWGRLPSIQEMRAALRDDD